MGTGGIDVSDPVVILGVSRSGTTLLREMLNRGPELAIPSESYFVPQLWDRHGPSPDVDAAIADLVTTPRVREWGISEHDIRSRVGPRARFADIVTAVYRAYAERSRKSRWGDKTPLYMQHLDVLEHAFPGARYVHIVRDGRDAALSFAGMRRRARFNLARPRSLDAFACQWRREVGDARRFGEQVARERYVEVRYEDLVRDPEPHLRRICKRAGLTFDAAMLEYHRHAGSAAGEDHRRLAEPPALRTRWPEEMDRAALRRFEAIAGDRLSELGYPLIHPPAERRLATYAAAARGAYDLRVAAWRAGLAAYRRTPAWRLRQLALSRAGA
jgi:hypothetical protein